MAGHQGFFNFLLVRIQNYWPLYFLLKNMSGKNRNEHFFICNIHFLQWDITDFLNTVHRNILLGSLIRKLLNMKKQILYDMGNSSEYFLIPSRRWEHVVVVSIQVGCQGWGRVIMMKKNLLLYFMFQSILNILRAS